MTKYYVDSCIWLNLLNREQNKVHGTPVWKIAKEFLKQHQGKIIISDVVFREIINKVRNPEELKRLAIEIKKSI